MAKQRKRSRGSNALEDENSFRKITEEDPSTGDDEDRNAPLEEDPDVCISPMKKTKKKRKSSRAEVLENGEGKKKMQIGSDDEENGDGKQKRKKVGNDDVRLITTRVEANVRIHIGEDADVAKQDYLTVDVGQTGERKKKKKKVGRDDSGLITPRGGSNVSIGIEQNYSNGVVGGPESNAYPIKNKEMKRDRATHDSESKVEIESMGSESPEPPTRSSSKRELKAKKKVRFQEPEDEFVEENANYMFIEEDVEEEIRNWKKDMVLPDLVYGRFTKTENETIKNSVLKYIEKCGWDVEEGLQKVLHSSQHADARGCWIEIAKCLPMRPVKQLYRRATIVLGGEKLGNWSADELEQLTNLQKIHGDDWRKIASNMDRSARLCRERWRHLKHARKTGSWTQEELDKLCKLVRKSLRVKSLIPAKTLDRRHIRDDVNWEWIAEQMQRDPSRCADTWYLRLASPMIPTEWANGDDHLLLQKLMELGAASEEALDWDTILDHRDGDQCMGRWKEMTKLLRTSDHVSFEDKLELLAKRYAADLLGMEEEL